MGRGLSPLQQTILRLAYQNRMADSGYQDEARADVFYCEIFESHYGWPSIWKNSRKAHGQKFTKAEVGERQYNAAHAAVSRAALRLEQRGLVTCVRGFSWAGVNLTEAGNRIAKEL